MAPKRNSKNKLISTCAAGSQFTNFCFSHDSRYLFCCCGSVIQVFNTTNGESLHSLIGHTGIVKGIIVNPKNVLQIYSCGEDGLLIAWDYLDGVKLKQHNLHMPLHGIISIDEKTESIMMVAARTLHHDHDGNQYGLLQWTRDKENPGEFSQPTVLIQNCSAEPGLVSFGCNKSVAAAAQMHKLYVYNMKDNSVKSLKDKDKHNKDKKITAVACHPTEHCIAAGNETGKIMFWYNFYGDQKAHTSMVHWHSLAVLCLDFSPDGSLLLSGGHECVFVRWQMNNQHQKDFKPRMGAPLTKVMNSPDGNFFATLHADNVVQVMDVNMSILHVQRGMSRANWNLTNPKHNPIPVGMTYDPRSRSIITNGLPGHLQFYSLSLQKQLYNLDIVGQNYISPANINRPPVVTEIKQAAISEDGHWLASFEMWDDGFFTPELRLKFWEYSSVKQTYVLNTIVETPHETKINSMSFRPSPPPSTGVKSSPMLVTTGHDRCFKLWTLVDDTDIYRENTRWDCDSVGFYKDMNTETADFSCDGSSLAVAFDHLITVWDPVKNFVKTSLSDSAHHKGIIRHVKFGSGDSRYFLMSLSDSHLTSWNLLSLNVEWSMATGFVHLVKDPVSDLMATFTQNNALTVFRPSSSQTVYTQDKVCDCPVLSAVFVPNNRATDLVDVGWPGSSQLYMYTANHHLLTLDSHDRIVNADKVKIHQHIPKSGLSAIMAEKVVKETQEDVVMKDTQGKTHLVEDPFVSAMLHSNEPISAFCNQFLDKLIMKRNSKSKTHLKAEDAEEDEEKEGQDDSNEPTFPLADILPEPDLAHFFKEESQAVKKHDKELNHLLSKPVDWLQWCGSLSSK